MHRGFIKLHRKFSEWEWYKDNNTKAVFLDLLINANHKESKFKGLKIQRGQIVVGRIKLADKLNFTEQQIRTALNKLKSTREITIKTTNRFSIVTLINYELYQDKGGIDNQQNNQQLNQQITNKQPTDNQQITTSKEVKNEKNEKNEKNKTLVLFEEFWKLYPKEGSKKNTLKKYQTILKNKKATHEELMAGLKRYVADIERNNTPKQYRKGPEPWLNGEYWKLEYSTGDGRRSVFDTLRDMEFE